MNGSFGYRWTFLFLSVALILCTTVSLSSQPVVTQVPGDWAQGTRIVFFAGGPEGGPFAVNIYNGARQAEYDLHARVDYRWSDWNSQAMIEQFRQAVASMPDGICIMGHPGDAALGSLIDQAEQNGIIVTTQNVPLPAAQGRYAARGFGYVGADNYAAGYSLGVESVRRFQLRPTDSVLVWGLLSQPDRGVRTRGVLDALRSASIPFDYIEIESSIDRNPASGVSVFARYVSSHPNVRLVVVDHGMMTASAETYLRAAEKTADQIAFVGFDLLPATIPAIRAGWVDLVMDQQEWLQGYLPILQVCLTKAYGFSGLRIDTGSGFVDRSNIDAIAALAQRQIR